MLQGVTDMENNMFPVSREMFVDIMTRYRDTIDITEQVSDLYCSNPRLFVSGEGAWPSSLDDVISLLNIIFELEEDRWGNTLIDYWFREQNFGREASDDYEFMIDGKPLPVGYGPEEIYDLICQMTCAS